MASAASAVNHHPWNLLKSPAIPAADPTESMARNARLPGAPPSSVVLVGAAPFGSSPEMSVFRVPGIASPASGMSPRNVSICLSSGID